MQKFGALSYAGANDAPSGTFLTHIVAKLLAKSSSDSVAKGNNRQSIPSMRGGNLGVGAWEPIGSASGCKLLVSGTEASGTEASGTEASGTEPHPRNQRGSIN
jgi:hypothetical protein